MAFDTFHHNPEHGVIVCRQCETCLMPRESSWVGHLRIRPHHMKGEHLVRTLEHFHSFGNFSSVDDLRQRAAARRRQDQPCRPVDGLALYEGFICTCTATCFFSTRRLDKIRKHICVHGRKPKEHSDATPLWRACQLQTYFTAKGIIDYFEVDDAVPIHPQQTARLDPSCTISTLASTSAATSTPTRTEDGRAAIFEDVKGEIEAHFEPARRAQDPLRANARADREPWLVNTGFGAHLDGLLDAEIRSSYALPSSVDADLLLDDAPEDASKSDLQRILVAAEHTLRDAYRLCSDTSALPLCRPPA